MFFKRNQHAKRLWRELYDELEPLNKKLKNEIGFPEKMSNVLWDQMVFNSAIHLYAEALSCFHNNIFESSMIMCRNAIDSTFYLASTILRTEDPLKFHSSEKSAMFSKNKWYWEEIKKNAIILDLLKESDIEFVEKIRDAGNFSAHLVIRQDESYRLLPKKNEQINNSINMENDKKKSDSMFINYGFKRWTHRDEALIILTDTKNIIAKIIQNYFTNPKTLIISL